MPIVNEENDVSIQYKIPNELKEKIPDYFYPAFAGELCSVFGPHIFFKEDEIYGISYVSSTYGWSFAMKATCAKLGIDWLSKYYDELQ